MGCASAGVRGCGHQRLDWLAALCTRSQGQDFERWVHFCTAWCVTVTVGLGFYRCWCVTVAVV